MIIKLTQEHIEIVREAFFHDIGTRTTNDRQIRNQILYESFCNNYLMGLDNFHAFGKIDNGKIVSFISFYESIDEPSWYQTSFRNIGKPEYLIELLDNIIEYNENNGRLKFYTLLMVDQQNVIKRFELSDNAIERYGCFDEYVCKENQKPYFNQHWEILYKRTLIPTETVVCCNYLKRKYRTTLPNLGNI